MIFKVYKIDNVNIYSAIWNHEEFVFYKYFDKFNKYRNNSKKPNMIRFDKDGNKLAEHWYNSDGKYHRDNDLPAYISYYKTGEIETKQWCINGDLYRKNNYAVIYYYKDGNILSKSYYYKDGNILSKSY